jgi:hypothetical protein
LPIPETTLAFFEGARFQRSRRFAQCDLRNCEPGRLWIVRRCAIHDQCAKWPFSDKAALFASGSD